MVLAPHHVWAVRALLTIMVRGGLAGPKSEMPWDLTHFGVDGRVSERLKDRSAAWPQLLPARPPTPQPDLPDPRHPWDPFLSDWEEDALGSGLPITVSRSRRRTPTSVITPWDPGGQESLPRSSQSLDDHTARDADASWDTCLFNLLGLEF